VDGNVSVLCDHACERPLPHEELTPRHRASGHRHQQQIRLGEAFQRFESGSRQPAVIEDGVVQVE
jgi:hypothetical protein